MIRRCGAAFFAGLGARLTSGQRKSLAAMGACRTPAMGTHLQACSHCGAEFVLYNSCGDRHCPQCQGGRRAAWFQKQQQDLLPVQYFHVVFTVPDTLNILALAHPAECYNLLFRAARETLLEASRTSRYLGGQVGGVMVLHTWGQNLSLHPHLHVIVPGGALSPDGQAWRSCPRDFFLPVQVLSRLFRGKLLAYLQESYDAGRLPMTGEQAHLADPCQFRRFLSPLYRKEWVVYAKPPFDGEPESILGYMARTIHRVAISNQRLVSIDNGSVSFLNKDYARGNCWLPTTLSADEFLRRLSQHILPSGFMRVRAFGFLANCHRKQKLALIRQLLDVPPPAARHQQRSGRAARNAAGDLLSGVWAARLVHRTPDTSPEGTRVARQHLRGRTLRQLMTPQVGTLDASRDPATIDTYRPSGIRALLRHAEPLPGTIRIIRAIDRISGHPRSAARHGFSGNFPKTPPLAS